MNHPFRIRIIIMLISGAICCNSCTKDPPSVTTRSVSDITPTSAVSGGNVEDNGGADVKARGVCWSTTPNPDITSNKTSDGTGNGSFTSSITGLTENTAYYVCAYATNSAGTDYGDPISFNTSKLTITDADGNIYTPVTIGSQIWTKENLKTTKFNDGTNISLVTDNTVWANLTTAAYCWPNNNESVYKNIYGALYNWYAVSTGNLCPIGWRVPTDPDWTTLTNYLGGLNIAGGKMKEQGFSHWISPNTGATNESGFTGLPSGFRSINGIFSDIGYDGFWWSNTQNTSTTAWDRGLFYDLNEISKGEGYKFNGISVRCLKN